MNTLRITKEFTFELAHALHGYSGKCANIHGHSYHMRVTVMGKPVTDEKDPNLGMVMDMQMIITDFALIVPLIPSLDQLVVVPTSISRKNK